MCWSGLPITLDHRERETRSGRRWAVVGSRGIERCLCATRYHIAGDEVRETLPLVTRGR